MKKNLLEMVLNLMLDGDKSQVKGIEYTPNGIEAILVDKYDGETYYLTLEKKLRIDS